MCTLYTQCIYSNIIKVSTYFYHVPEAKHILITVIEGLENQCKFKIFDLESTISNCSQTSSTDFVVHNYIVLPKSVGQNWQCQQLSSNMLSVTDTNVAQTQRTLVQLQIEVDMTFRECSSFSTTCAHSTLIEFNQAFTWHDLVLQ